MTTEQLEKLIECVRSNPQLYDTDHKDYKSTKFKDEMWAEIALSCLYENGSTAKKQWKNLRDSHRESIKRMKTKSGQGAKDGKKWKFHDSMSFLEKFMCKRDSQSNISEISEDSQTTVHQGEQNKESSKGENLKKTKLSKEDKILNIIKVNQKMRQNRDIIKNDLRSRNISQPANQAPYNFFLFMYETAVTFPPHLQREAKRKVFNVLTECEERVESLSPGLSPRLSPDFRPICSTPEISSDVHNFRSTPLSFTEENSVTTASEGMIQFVERPSMVDIPTNLEDIDPTNNNNASTYYTYSFTTPLNNTQNKNQDCLSSFLKFNK